MIIVDDVCITSHPISVKRRLTLKLLSGAGNAPGGPDGVLTKVFAEAVQRGIVIVNVTQCECASF